MQHSSAFPIPNLTDKFDLSSPMHNDNSPTSTDINSIALDFTALLLAGDFRAAGEKYWAEDVVSIEPYPTTDVTDGVCQGIDAVRTRNRRWFSTHAIEDLSLDGPFITGDHFALFADMFIVHAGRRTPHSQIAVFAVREGKIVEERYFHP